MPKHVRLLHLYDDNAKQYNQKLYVITRYIYPINLCAKAILDNHLKAPKKTNAFQTPLTLPTAFHALTNKKHDKQLRLG